jgi:hypothetical protein
VRAGTNGEPHRKLTINLNYQLRKNVEPEKNTDADFNLEAFFTPFTTLSINARLNVTQREETRTLQNYVVNWSPFPDGTLQFFFTYNETLQSEENARQRTIAPGLSWTIGSHVFLDITYNIITDESDTQKTEANTFVSNVKITF